MKKRLLVVEDNARLLQAIAACLRQAGYDVMTARDGGEALVQIAETIPDLIVADVMMPVADGYVLTKQLRANPRTDLIPIIFLTARDARRDRLEGIRMGVDAYLVKPFEPEELVAVIENILSRISRTHRRVARASGVQLRQAQSAEKSEPVSGLTEAEERVAALVAQTLSNKEIAARLKISVRTVEMHISNILSKMGWSNRVEIARFIIKRDSAG
ncbi:MAG: response regulator transcription factor [Pyrinomonadaceae bacterium]